MEAQPPAASIPVLQALEDEGLVRSSEVDTKRVYQLTEAGQAEATERRLARRWTAMDGRSGWARIGPAETPSSNCLFGAVKAGRPAR